MDAPIKYQDDMAKGQDSVNPTGLQDSPFAKLSMEILLQILGDIRLQDSFALSQTCRDLRYLTHTDWKAAYAKLPREMQAEFLTDLTFTQPNSWLCGICMKLHNVRDFRDIDENLYRELPCLREQRKGHMAHARIQLATKAVRFQHLLTGELRPEALLKPWSLPQIRSPRLELEPLLKAVPKVVEGRFLLFVEFNFVWDVRQEAPALKDLLQCNYPFCAHLETSTCQIPYCSHLKKDACHASHLENKPLFGSSADNKYFEQLVHKNNLVRHVTSVDGSWSCWVEICRHRFDGNDRQSL